MKNFIFKSKVETSDFTKIFKTLNVVQAEQRHARYDLQQILKQLDIIKKGMAILVSQPEPEELEEIGSTETDRDGV